MACIAYIRLATISHLAITHHTAKHVHLTSRYYSETFHQAEATTTHLSSHGLCAGPDGLTDDGLAAAGSRLCLDKNHTTKGQKKYASPSNSRRYQTLVLAYQVLTTDTRWGPNGILRPRAEAGSASQFPLCHFFSFLTHHFFYYRPPHFMGPGATTVRGEALMSRNCSNLSTPLLSRL